MLYQLSIAQGILLRPFEEFVRVNSQLPFECYHLR